MSKELYKVGNMTVRQIDQEHNADEAIFGLFAAQTYFTDNTRAETLYFSAEE